MLQLFHGWGIGKLMRISKIVKSCVTSWLPGNNSFADVVIGNIGRSRHDGHSFLEVCGYEHIFDHELHTHLSVHRAHPSWIGLATKITDCAIAKPTSFY